MPKSNLAGSKPKPKKPHKDFPLFAHNNGQWAKKVRGRLCYFGPWADPTAALLEWIRVKDDLIAGKEPRPAEGEFTVQDICNAFLEYCEDNMESGELTQRSFNDYLQAAKAIVRAFGKNRIADDIRPKDFAKLRKQISQGRRPKTVENWVGRCRVIINFANANELTEKPISFGTYFKKPKAKTIREDRTKQLERGTMDLSALQIRDVLSVACVQLKAMILLAANTGIGNADLGRIEFHNLDLDRGWMDYPRHKTAVDRRAKLWPETVEAVREAIENRVEPKDSDFNQTIFITRIGKRWFNEVSSTDPIAQAFRKLLKQTGHHVKGVGFYALRRTFETVAADTRDQPAIDLSMGHHNPSMAALYCQRLGDPRLEAVAEHVRRWLFEIDKETENV